MYFVCSPTSTHLSTLRSTVLYATLISWRNKPPQIGKPPIAHEFFKTPKQKLLARHIILSAFRLSKFIPRSTIFYIFFSGTITLPYCTYSTIYRSLCAPTYTVHYRHKTCHILISKTARMNESIASCRIGQLSTTVPVVLSATGK